MAENLVSTEWLAARLSDPDLRVVDASWHMPATQRSGAAEFRERHIPGAVFFDIDAITDRSSPLPHMLPSAAQFAEAMGALGIGEGDRIVVYDSLGLFSAARVWWTLRVFGAAEVSVLDGGLPKWLAERRPVGSGEARPAPRRFTARLDCAQVADVAAVKAALASGSAQVLDARSAERFEGRAPEPRPGLRSGHMPGGFNLPFDELVTEGRLKDAPALRAVFAARGVDLAQPLITSCGSGVTAAILSLAAEQCGGTVAGLYDGSWSEWGGREDCEVVTGAA